MNIYIVSVADSVTVPYDKYDSHVIAARTPKEAKQLAELPGDKKDWKVRLIGTCNQTKACILHSSFNAG